MQIAAAGLDGWAFLEFRRLLLRIFSVIGVRGSVMSWVSGARSQWYPHSLKTKDVRPPENMAFAKGNDDFNPPFLGVIFSSYIGLCGCWCKHFKSVLGIITWWKAVMLMGMSWWLLPYIGEMFINIGFLITWTKDNYLRFFQTWLGLFTFQKLSFWLQHPETISWWQGVMLAVVLLPLHYQASSCQSFTIDSDGLGFIDSYDGRLTRIPKCWISWVSLILESQHETAIGWGLG